MERESKQNPIKPGASIGLGFWVMVIAAGLIGKFFGLIGGAIFLGVWWLIDYYRTKSK